VLACAHTSCTHLNHACRHTSHPTTPSPNTPQPDVQHALMHQLGLVPGGHPRGDERQLPFLQHTMAAEGGPGGLPTIPAAAERWASAGLCPGVPQLSWAGVGCLPQGHRAQSAPACTRKQQQPPAVPCNTRQPHRLSSSLPTHRNSRVSSIPNC